MLLICLNCLLVLLQLYHVVSIEIDLKLIRLAKSFTSSKDYINNDFYYAIPLFIGTDPQDLEVLYETNFTHLFINPNSKTMTHNFNSSLSSTFKQTSTVHSVDDFRGVEVSDVVMFAMNQFTCPWLYGYSGPEQYSFFDGVIGFGKQYTNDEEGDGSLGKRFSLLHQLNQLNKNPKRLFGHKYFSNDQYLRLYIGEINDEEYLNNPNHPKCTANSNRKDLKHKWNCLLREIAFSSGERLNITGYVYFSTGSNMITGPNVTEIDLIGEIIKQQGDNCNKYYVAQSKSGFRCSSAIDVNAFPEITFKLNGVDLTLKRENLVFKEFNIRGEGFIYKSRIELDANEKHWSLGQPIMRGHAMVFNEEDGSVGFWSLRYDKNYMREIWVISGGSLILAGIILVLILLRIKGKEEKLNSNGSSSDDKKNTLFKDKVIAY